MNGWIEYSEYDVKPADHLRIDVKFRDGTVLTDVRMNEEGRRHGEGKAGELSYGTTSGFWEDERQGNDIVAYRLAEVQSEYSDVVSDGGFDPRNAMEIPNVNPKQQFGMSKLPMHLASPLATAYMAIGLGNGALKYGTANFKATPVLASIYIAGLKRHVDAWLEGEENDPDDGAPHLGAALANLAIIIEARANGTLIDDRPIGEGYLKEREMLTEIWQQIQQKHAGKQPHHFTRNNA